MENRKETEAMGYLINMMIVALGDLRDAVNELGNLQGVKEILKQIYETLGPDECLIISKSEEGLLVARNEDGKVILERIHNIQHVYAKQEIERKIDGSNFNGEKV